MSYPSTNDDYFYEKITKKYKKYTIPRRRQSFHQICYPKKFKLQPSQLFVSKYINPKTPYKGLMVMHGLGSGKTITSIMIGEAWKKYRKIKVVVPASLIGNYRDELRSPATKNAYITNAAREKLKELHPASDEYKDIIERSNKKINKYYTIYSYNKFVELAKEGEISLRNSVLIIDEIQNMVSEDGTYYETLYDTIHSAPASLRIVLLSATPLTDKPVELALTMNLLRIPYELPTGREFEKMFYKTYKKRGLTFVKAKNLDIFKERIKGYVSYYRGADPRAYPEVTVRYVKCEMSNFQYRSYITVLKEDKSKAGLDFKRRHKVFVKGQLKRLPSSFYGGVRMISNIAFPNKKINELGYRSLQGKELKMNNVKKYSIKFYRIIQRILRGKGLMLVYSNFKEYGGLKSLARILEAQGFLDYSEYGEGSRRYGVWSGDVKPELREEMKAVFNNPNNINGRKLKVILLSPAGREGVSFKCVRQIHILEPYWNNTRLQQVQGRGIRYCSSKALPPEDRNVKVYIYLATHYREEVSIDQFIASLAQRKNKLAEEFNMAMKQASVDCSLFYHGNVFREDKGTSRYYECDT